MLIGIYLTHPQVEINPALAVPHWELSALGRARALKASKKDWVKTVGTIFSSAENKAVETAEIFAKQSNQEISVFETMGENDRSSTGFLPPDEFELAADAFMNKPNESFKGWERAIDAQARIVDAVDRALVATDPEKITLFVGHGGVGTLLKCHLGRRQIARREDQPANGGGNIFAFALETGDLLCDWVTMEEFNIGMAIR